MVANTGGYLIAAFFFAAPVRWLGGYVARIGQVIGSDEPAEEPGAPPGGAEARRATDALSVREVEVVQLVADGATNEEIAARLVLSPRTIQSHVKAATEKTGTRNRTELAVLAVRGGWCPERRSKPLSRPTGSRTSQLRHLAGDLEAIQGDSRISAD